MMRELLLFMLFIGSCMQLSGQNNRPLSSAKSKLHMQYIGDSPHTGGSLAVVVSEAPLAHTTQFLPVDKYGKIADPKNLTAQLKQVFDNVAIALKLAGSDLDQAVKLNICVAAADLVPKVRQYILSRFKAGKRPAVGFVTGDLVPSAALIAVDAVAVSTVPATKEVKYLQSKDLFGPAQQSQVALLPGAGVVYVSGQAANGEIAGAARATLRQLDSTLKYLGLKKKDIIQIKSFICPATDINLVKKEVSDFFAGHTVPPTVYIEWTSKKPLIEIELIAASPAGITKPLNQLDFITPAGMTASPVYSKVTRINYGRRVYLSSLYAEKPTEAKNEVAAIFGTMAKVLTKAGSDFDHLAKATYYVVTDSASNELNEIRPKYYKSDSPPAASKAKVKGVGLKDNGICIDMIGVVKEKEH